MEEHPRDFLSAQKSASVLSAVREGGNDIKGAPRPICQRYFPGIYFGLFMRSHFSGKEEGAFVTRLCYRHNFSRLFVRGVAPDDDLTEPTADRPTPRV